MLNNELESKMEYHLSTEKDAEKPQIAGVSRPGHKTKGLLLLLAPFRIFTSVSTQEPVTVAERSRA
jgi:hypothetical protein